MRSIVMTRINSFQYAFQGIWYLIRTTPNAWIHALVTFAVIVMGLWLNLTLMQWAVIVLAIGMVWTAEYLNTALEAVVDLASPDIHDLAKASKDVAAAGVLVSAGCAALVGLLIMGPPLLARITAIWLVLLGT